MLVERNIFSRTRGRKVRQPAPRVTAPKPTPQKPPQEGPNPERFVVLRGIVLQDGLFIAFIEDTLTRKTTKVRIGDSVARGMLKNITLDYVEYESYGRTVKVAVSSNFVVAETAPAGDAEQPAEAGPTEDSNTSTSSTGTGVKKEGLSVLERLRQRRQRELAE